MERLKKIQADNRVRYLVAGGGSFTVEYLFFVALDFSGVNLFLANSASFIVGLTISFLVHRNWSFKGEQRHSQRRQAVAYVSLAMINLGLTNVVIGLLTFVHIPSFVAKVVTMSAMICWNFFLLNRFIFQRIAQKNEDS